jgi:very-short-patch-repair endonuclease
MQTKTARNLRRNSTDAERLLWRKLRSRRLIDAKFRCQQTIAQYVVDFICFEEHLIIELDGGQHATEPPARQRYLDKAGYRVVWFLNKEVLDKHDGVV